MKKGAIIGIAIAIIVAGGVGIYAVFNTEGPLGDESSMEFNDEATATVEPDFGEEGADEFGFEDEATATVEEDSSEGQGDDFGFEDRASATVENP